MESNRAEDRIGVRRNETTLPGADRRRLLAVQPDQSGPAGPGGCNISGCLVKAAGLPLTSMTRLDRITTSPAICHGKPTVRGLRYPVEVLLELLASGMTIEEILEDYPDLERDDLLAAHAT